MFLLDSSILINLLRRVEDEKLKLLDFVIDNNLPYGISILTYQEILQGS